MVDSWSIHGRFYAPCLPWPIAAAAEGWSKRDRAGTVLWLAWAIGLASGVQQGWLPGSEGWSIDLISEWTYAAYVVAAGAVFWRGRGAILVIVGIVLAHPALPSQSLSDGASVARLRDVVSSWRGLERAGECLGTDRHVYHSEIGVPGYYFSRVTDLGGLMNTEVHEGLRFEQMCLRDRPALIFLPHRNYRTLNAEIRQGACLGDYKRVVKRSSSPLFVRRDLLKEYRSSTGCGQKL